MVHKKFLLIKLIIRIVNNNNYHLQYELLHQAGNNTRKYIIRAKFQNGEPQFSIIDTETNQVHLRWKLEKIEEIFENGEIKREEFL